MTTNTPFADGKLPPMPKIEIDELTAKEISQDKVDKSLHILWDEKPDLVIGMAEGEYRPEIRQSDEYQDRLDAVERYLRKEVAPQVGGFENPSVSDQVMWELRVRVRRALGLPATIAEVKAAIARGERVV